MANIKADEISKILREQIANYEQTVSVDEVGAIISVGDGIARIHGLENVMAGEMLAFPAQRFWSGAEPGRGRGWRGAAGRVVGVEGRRRGETHQHDHVRARGAGADRARGESAGIAAG